MIALVLAHRLSSLGLSHLDPVTGEDLEKHAGGRTTSIINGSARPVENHRLNRAQPHQLFPQARAAAAQKASN